MMIILNLIANSVTTIAVTFFIIAVFGRKSKAIESLPAYEYYALKISLCVLASGSLLNALTGHAHHATEVLLSLGVALIFSWAAWFHWKYFVRKK